MDRLRENQIYTGTVEGYSSEGLGIVRLDGAVVFVPRAVRGETIDLKITKVMKTAAAGEIVKIRDPSPDRAALHIAVTEENRRVSTTSIATADAKVV